MKKLLVGLVAGALALGATASWAADPVTLQLKWVTQAQFAGYFVAKDKGFYTEEGIDITIKPGGPDIAPEQVIAGGGADVIAIVDGLVGHRDDLAGIEPVDTAQGALLVHGAEAVGEVTLDVVADMGVAGDPCLEDLAEGSAAFTQRRRQAVDVEELAVAEHQPAMPIVERDAVRQVLEDGVQVHFLGVQLAARRAERARQLQQLGIVSRGCGVRRVRRHGFSGLWQGAGVPEIPRKAELHT